MKANKAAIYTAPLVIPQSKNPVPRVASDGASTGKAQAKARPWPGALGLPYSGKHSARRYRRWLPLNCASEQAAPSGTTGGPRRESACERRMSCERAWPPSSPHPHPQAYPLPCALCTLDLGTTAQPILVPTAYSRIRRNGEEEKKRKRSRLAHSASRGNDGECLSYLRLSSYAFASSLAITAAARVGTANENEAASSLRCTIS